MGAARTENGKWNAIRQYISADELPYDSFSSIAVNICTKMGWEEQIQ